MYSTIIWTFICPSVYLYTYTISSQKQQCEDTEILRNQNENTSGDDAQSISKSGPCPTELHHSVRLDEH